MKKILLIISVNILIFLLLLYGLTEYLYKHPDSPLLTMPISSFKKYNVDISGYPTEDENGLIHLTNDNAAFRKYCGEERRKINTDKSKNPIILTGCSYAYGHGLRKEESFGYLLSDLTDRPVYGFTFCGSEGYSGLKNLELMHNADISEFNEKISKSDYVIYVYMYDHIVRYLETDFLVNNYDEIFQPNKFERFFLRNFAVKNLLAHIKKKIILHNYPESKNAQLYMKRILGLLYKTSKKYLPDAKFIVIIYDEKISDKTPHDKIKFTVDVINSPIWQEFAKENDVTVVHTKDIMGFYFDRDYKLNEDISEWHPNARAWKEFTPLFVKEYIH